MFFLCVLFLQQHNGEHELPGKSEATEEFTISSFKFSLQKVREPRSICDNKLHLVTTSVIKCAYLII